jgi:hypothetical protein
VTRKAALIISAAAVCAACTGCSRCNEPADGTAEAVAKYDKIPLGATEATVRAGFAALGGFDPQGATRFVKCTDLSRIDALDLEETALIEKPAGDHSLVRCTLLGGMFHRPSPILSAQGDLLDGRAVSVSWNFAQSDFDKRLAELTAYLGAGQSVRLEERSALGELQRAATVWRRGDDAWALLSGLETRILKQDARALRALAAPADPPARGSKVSLEDIGLGGGLDLAKPVPDLSAILPPDAGSR